MTSFKGDLGWPLRRAAALHDASVAVVDGDRTVTYGELARRIGALGAVLDELGVAPGGRVGFLGVNSLAHVECTMGVPIFGRVVVSLNFRLAAAELAFMVDDCEVEVLVVDAEHLELGRELRESCPSLRELVLAGATAAPAAAADCLDYEGLLKRAPIEAAPVDEDTLAAISYTGGTTGRPKGVMLSHGNLLANARHNLIATGHASSHVWLHVCPMFHVAGTANLYACTWAGSRQVIVPRFVADAVLDVMLDYEISHVALVPTMITMLLDELDRRSLPRLGSLRHLQYAASPITPDTQRRLLERLDGDLVQFYGMTETAATVTSLPAADHRAGHDGEPQAAARLRSIGVPVVGVEAEVRDKEGVRVGVGDVGELWVRGPNVMLGYWNRSDATSAALVDGWYRTGDAARADQGGYLYLVDRIKDMIITGAENVYSIEVEAALTDHPQVLEACVFGIPDERWGEAVHAVVTVPAGSSLTVQELIEHCRSRIAGYKIPRTIDFHTDPLPKSGAGKLLKNVLRDPFWAGRDRQIN